MQGVKGFLTYRIVFIHILKVLHTKLQYVHQSGWPEALLCLVCMFCLGLCRFSPRLLQPLNTVTLVRLIGNFLKQVSAMYFYNAAVQTGQIANVNGIIN